MSRRLNLAMLAAVPVALVAVCAHAADLKVLAAGSVQEAFKELVPAFTRESGHKI